MNITQVEQLITETVELIAVSGKSLADAKPRASRFLVVNSILATFLRDLEEELPKFDTLVSATYAQAIMGADGKNITEKKVTAEAEPNYCTARENKEKLDAVRNWVKNHMDIFENAHVMYRQYSNSRD